MLIFGCLVLFLWPRTVVVEVLGTGSMREEEEENRTEKLIDQLLAEVTTEDVKPQPYCQGKKGKKHY